MTTRVWRGALLLAALACACAAAFDEASEASDFGTCAHSGGTYECVDTNDRDACASGRTKRGLCKGRSHIKCCLDRPAGGSTGASASTTTTTTTTAEVCKGDALSNLPTTWDAAYRRFTRSFSSHSRGGGIPATAFDNKPRCPRKSTAEWAECYPTNAAKMTWMKREAYWRDKHTCAMRFTGAVQKCGCDSTMTGRYWVKTTDDRDAMIKVVQAKGWLEHSYGPPVRVPACTKNYEKLQGFVTFEECRGQIKQSSTAGSAFGHVDFFWGGKLEWGTEPRARCKNRCKTFFWQQTGGAGCEQVWLWPTGGELPCCSESSATTTTAVVSSTSTTTVPMSTTTTTVAESTTTPTLTSTTEAIVSTTSTTVPESTTTESTTSTSTLTDETTTTCPSSDDTTTTTETPYTEPPTPDEQTTTTTETPYTEPPTPDEQTTTTTYTEPPTPDEQTTTTTYTEPPTPDEQTTTTCTEPPTPDEQTTTTTYTEPPTPEEQTTTTTTYTEPPTPEEHTTTTTYTEPPTPEEQTTTTTYTEPPTPEEQTTTTTTSDGGETTTTVVDVTPSHTTRTFTQTYTGTGTGTGTQTTGVATTTAPCPGCTTTQTQTQPPTPPTPCDRVEGSCPPPPKCHADYEIEVPAGYHDESTRCCPLIVCKCRPRSVLEQRCPAQAKCGKYQHSVDRGAHEATNECCRRVECECLPKKVLKKTCPPVPQCAAYEKLVESCETEASNCCQEKVCKCDESRTEHCPKNPVCPPGKREVKIGYHDPNTQCCARTTCEDVPHCKIEVPKCPQACPVKHDCMKTCSATCVANYHSYLDVSRHHVQGAEFEEKVKHLNTLLTQRDDEPAVTHFARISFVQGSHVNTLPRIADELRRHAMSYDQYSKLEASHPAFSQQEFVAAAPLHDQMETIIDEPLEHGFSIEHHEHLTHEELESETQAHSFLQLCESRCEQQCHETAPGGGAATNSEGLPEGAYIGEMKSHWRKLVNEGRSFYAPNAAHPVPHHDVHHEVVEQHVEHKMHSHVQEAQEAHEQQHEQQHEQLPEQQHDEQSAQQHAVPVQQSHARFF